MTRSAARTDATGGGGAAVDAAVQIAFKACDRVAGARTRLGSPDARRDTDPTGRTARPVCLGRSSARSMTLTSSSEVPPVHRLRPPSRAATAGEAPCMRPSAPSPSTIRPHRPRSYSAISPLVSVSRSGHDGPVAVWKHTFAGTGPCLGEALSYRPVTYRAVAHSRARQPLRPTSHRVTVRRCTCQGAT